VGFRRELPLVTIRLENRALRDKARFHGGLLGPAGGLAAIKRRALRAKPAGRRHGSGKSSSQPAII